MDESSHAGLFFSEDVGALRGVIDAVPHPIFVKDEQTRFVIVNEMMCTLMQRSFSDLVGKTDFDFVPREQAEVFRGNDLRVLSTGETNENEELFSDAEGNLRTIVTRKKRLVLPDGKRMLVGCITDISDFRRTEALVRYHAEHDALTGLPNRRLFAARTMDVARQVDRYAKAYSILLVDLDRFKPINDVFGHTTGDAVLCEIAVRLTKIVRTGATIARLGGDEFAIICETSTSLEIAAEEARTLAADVIAVIQEPIRLSDQTVNVDASVGIAQCPSDGMDLDTLLHCADIAMYRAKHDGREKFRFFEEGMDADIRRQALLESELRRAVANRDIEPYYQPLVDLAAGRIVGFEILARWQHPTRGLVEPEVFIPIAERLGLISELTLSLLSVACHQAMQWPETLLLALNLSPTQLGDSVLPMRILAVLKDAGFPPTRLEIEVTESALIADLPKARSILTSFRNLGMRISLDDFGRGASSMYHLRELRFDKLKIDRSFVQSMQSNPESAKIVNAIIGLSKELGLTTVAEGIEDVHAMKRMIDEGCDFGQGFLFGKAVSAAEAKELITHSSRVGVRRATARRLNAG